MVVIDLFSIHVADVVGDVVGDERDTEPLVSMVTLVILG
jgi:hypothetical protein